MPLHRHFVRQGAPLADPGFQLLEHVEIGFDALDAVFGEQVRLEFRSPLSSLAPAISRAFLRRAGQPPAAGQKVHWVSPGTR